jgi:hypothetical protein
MWRFGWLLISLATSASADVESNVILQTSPLAGFPYHAGRVLFPLMQVGDRLQLTREPDNPYDGKAVRVEWRGVMIGYAPRAENVDLARLMDHGTHVEARIINLQQARNPWRRVLFEVLVVDGGH